MSNEVEAQGARELDEVAERIRKNIYMLWQKARKEFGQAGWQKLTRDMLIVELEAYAASEREARKKAEAAHEQLLKGSAHILEQLRDSKFAVEGQLAKARELLKEVLETSDTAEFEYNVLTVPTKLRKAADAFLSPAAQEKKS